MPLAHAGSLALLDGASAEGAASAWGEAFMAMPGAAEPMGGGGAPSCAGSPREPQPTAPGISLTGTLRGGEPNAVLPSGDGRRGLPDLFIYIYLFSLPEEERQKLEFLYSPRSL